MNLIFKICPVEEWKKATQTGRYCGSPADLRDGFIHLSASHQLQETAAKHFSGMKELVLIAFSADQLGAELKWEPSRGGDLFPHFYGFLPTDLALWIKPLPLHNGKRQFPADVFA
jgi:uncharacterized protein (DUF952 family)